MLIKLEKRTVITLTICALGFTACSGDQSPKNDSVPMGRKETRKRDFGNLFGDDFLMFGGPKKPGSPGMMSSATVNPFIWRASLDTVSFMPLTSADALGGVIVTDWYTTPSAPQERIKVTIYVTNPQLRADAVKVTLYKQLYKGGTWVNTRTNDTVATDMENIILSKARQLRVKHMEANK